MERKAKAHHRLLKKDRLTDEELFEFLKWWWRVKFNRPMKDPLLETYTAQDLAYEFFRYRFMTQDPDAIDENAKAIGADQEWIKKQMGKLKEDNAKATESKKEADPTPEIHHNFEET